MKPSEGFEAFILSMHPWRRQPGDALKSVANSLKLPSGQEKPSAKKDDPLWTSVDSLVSKEAYDEALTAAEAALAKGKEAGNAKAQALALYLSVHVKVLQDDRKAIEGMAKSLKDVAALYKEAREQREEEDVLLDILEFHLVNGQRSEADQIDRELRERLASANKKEEAESLLRIAAVYYSMGNMDKARGAVDEAVAAYSSVSDQEGLSSALRCSAVLYLGQQKFDDALKALERAVQGTGTNKANVQYGISQIYAAMGGRGVTDAIAALKKARSFMKDDRNQDGELEILQILSELLVNKQQGSEAIATNQDALAVTQASGDKKMEAKVLLRLLNANLSTQNDAEALKYGELAEVKARDADDIETQSSASSQVAEILLRRGDAASAIKRAKELLSLCRERNHSAGQGAAMQVLGQALLAENAQSAEGMRYLQAALGIFKDLDDFVGLHSAHFALANGFFTRGDLEDGLAHAREVLACCRRNGDKVNEELVKANIEKARQMTAQMRMTQPKRASIENAGILISPAGPQACSIKHSRVPGSLLDIVASGRNYWGTPRTVVDAAAEADERPPSHAVIWGHGLSDNSPTQMCLEFMDLVGAMAKGEITKIPIIVQTRGVFGRLCGNMGTGSMTDVAAVTLWGLIRTCRVEMPQVPILALDFAPGMTTAQIPRQLKPPAGVPETAYYNKSRWEPQMAAVPSLLRRDLKRDNLTGGGLMNKDEERKAKAESGTKFARKAFTWTGPSSKMDYCWYRQEWKAVGAAEGDIIVSDPLVPVRSLRQY